MHVVIVCDTASAVVFRYDADECSQEQLISTPMPRRRGGIQADYDGMVRALNQSMHSIKERIDANDVIVLATTKSYSDAHAAQIVAKLKQMQYNAVKRCTVVAGGQAGFNETLSTHLPSRHHAVGAPVPSVADADDVPPPKPPPKSAHSTLMRIATSAFTTSLTLWYGVV